MGFAPDLDPTTPGVIVACEMLVPTLIGMKGAASPVPAQGLPALDDEVTGAATVVLLTGTSRAFAGTATRIYEALSTSWLDVTRMTAAVTTSPASPTAGEAVTLTVAEPPTGAQGYTWQFDDGSESTATTDPKTTHTWADAGTYTVTCTVVLADNSTTAYTLTVTVAAAPDPAQALLEGPHTLGPLAAGDPLDAHMDAVSASDDTQVAEPYGGTDANVWRFAQMGNATLAVNGADPIQQSIVSGPFEDIPGSPVATVIDVTQGFVFVANVTDEIYGERPDGWWCSALYNQMDWVPDIATQCATGRLIDTPGAITACKALGSNVVLYKASSVIYGTYQGPPVIWAFTVASNEIGAPTQEAVISIGTAHVFLGNDNFYVYDGTRPQPIGDPVKEWFFADRDPAVDYIMRSMHDQRNSLVYWFYVSGRGDGTTIDSGIVYNYRANKWGHVAYRLEATFEHIVGQMTWDDLGTFYPTWDDLPAVAYNSPFWVNASRVPSIISPAHTVETLTGPCTASALQTGEMGDDETYTDLQYVRLRCKTDPASATMAGMHRRTLGSTDYETSKTTMHDGTMFDVDVSARWHSVVWAFGGDLEVLGYTPTSVPDGLF
jgi:PKD repeat protein